MILNEIHGNLFEYIENVDKNKKVVICHITNNIKMWGSGFVVPLGKRFPKAKTEYFRSNDELGDVSIHEEDNFIIMNMCSQNGIVGPDNPKPIRYEHLVNCMAYVRLYLSMRPDEKFELHCPRLGSERAKGNFQFIRELIEEIWKDYDTYLYYL